MEKSKTTRVEPFRFSVHGEDVGHSLATGQTGSGKTVWAGLEALWNAGHAGGKVSLAQVGNRAPYYRRFDKRR
ncbi:hypothetical protein [Paraburkholderia unamae]|uniref:Uncharacterized protein n=1 Tax=Paraburkholderia unamae TaxID=219649 RepID=A0ACC6RXD6_9BURK